MNKEAILEGLLFISGDEGITINDASKILEITQSEVKELLNALKSEYEKENRGLRISFIGEAFKLTTKREHKDYYQKLIVSKEPKELSQAALETLAIIAYNEPITRVEVDEIRGIASINIVRKLVSKDLITVCGKSDLPGHPNLYKTTKDFLDYFGLATLSDLPKLELKENLDNSETDLFKSIYKEE